MRDHFVQGVLTVEDEAYIGEPDFRLANGKTIHTLFIDLRPDDTNWEEENPVSQLSEVNQWYEILLVIQIGLGRKEMKITYSPSIPPGVELELVSTEIRGVYGTRKRNDIVRGIILDLNWDAASQQYLAVAGPVVYTRRFVLVETAIGKMVLSYKALQDRLGEQAEQLAPGGYLEWEPSRLDLLAIIAKREPGPGE